MRGRRRGKCNDTPPFLLGMSSGHSAWMWCQSFTQAVHARRCLRRDAVCQQAKRNKTAINSLHAVQAANQIALRCDAWSVLARPRKDDQIPEHVAMGFRSAEGQLSSCRVMDAPSAACPRPQTCADLLLRHGMTHACLEREELGNSVSRLQPQTVNWAPVDLTSGRGGEAAAGRSARASNPLGLDHSRRRAAGSVASRWEGRHECMHRSH